jgi:hypothetical protein
MNKNAPYVVSEWEWMKLKCAIYSARTKSQTMFIEHQFRDSPETSFAHYLVPDAIEILCKIHGAAIEQAAGASREEQLTLYADWVAAERQQIANIIEALPVLSTQIDVNKHIAFVIMHSRSMSSFPVCTFIGNGVSWIWPG